MTKKDPLTLRFDCGAVWLNLLATKGRTFSAEPVERLATPARLAQWLERCELSPARSPDTEDLERARWLREILRALALATVNDRTPPADAVADLASFLAVADEPTRLVAGDRLRREPPATTTAALARVARQAADHLTSSDRLSLKSCPEHDCQGLFIDPAGRRRWCPAPACASRGRVRALRARREAAAAGSAGEPTGSR